MKKKEIIQIHELLSQLHRKISEDTDAAETLTRELIEAGYLDDNGNPQTGPMSLERDKESHETAVSKLSTVLAENTEQLSEAEEQIVEEANRS